MILGIDTATAEASIALVENGRIVLEERSSGSHLRANHAVTLLPLLEKGLAMGRISWEGICAIAISSGPGSFTGLRIGLSTVKGLAFGWELPVVGVPTLLAIAARVTHWDGLVCPFLDARKKEVFAALFHKKDNHLERLGKDRVCSPQQVISEILYQKSSEPVLFLGDGTKPYSNLIQSALGSRAVATLGEDYPVTASAVARLGEEKIQREGVEAIGPMVPLYLRPSEAEVKSGLRWRTEDQGGLFISVDKEKSLI